MTPTEKMQELLAKQKEKEMIQMTYSPDTANAMSGVSFDVYENSKLACALGKSFLP